MQAIDPDVVSRVCARVGELAVAAGRSPGDVTVLAATKYLAAEHLQALVEAGVRQLAENRVESLPEKRAAVADPTVRWHFIGQLQSRKVTQVAGAVDTIHTLCSESAAARLDRLAQDGFALPSLFAQVNVARDPAKDGLLPEDLPSFLESLPETLRVSGLMTMPAWTDDPEASRPAFAELRELAASMQARFGDRHPVTALSMGTSQDWEVAVAEGATHVRLGRILYAEQE